MVVELVLDEPRVDSELPGQLGDLGRLELVALVGSLRAVDVACLTEVPSNQVHTYFGSPLSNAEPVQRSMIPCLGAAVFPSVSFVRCGSHGAASERSAGPPT